MLYDVYLNLYMKVTFDPFGYRGLLRNFIIMMVDADETIILFIIFNKRGLKYVLYF